jgi:UPF0716 protein FxsA
MLGRLILLFLLTPAVELALLIQVDQVIGFWPTVGLIVVTGIVGSHLARREGLSTWQRLNRRLQSGDLPGTELADGILILVAGALLITPGILTDVFGFLGLVPFSRAYLRRFVMRWFRRKMEQGTMQVQFGAFGGAAPGGPSSAGPASGPRQDRPLFRRPFSGPVARGPRLFGGVSLAGPGPAGARSRRGSERSTAPKDPSVLKPEPQSLY